MNRYDENYSAYFNYPTKAYPEGSAIDCSSEEQLDGTPIRAAFFNDVIGFMQAAFHGVFGNPKKEGDTVLREVSNEPDSAEKSDVWDAITTFVNAGDSAEEEERKAAVATEKEEREAADAEEKEERKKEDERLSELIESVKNSGMWCPFPVGAVYTQYPNCDKPEKLWGGTEWEKLNFGGAFFRADGGSSKAFNGGVQAAGLPNITGCFTSSADGYEGGYSNGAFWGDGNVAANTHSGSGHKFQITRFAASRSNSIYGRYNDVIPTNYTIQIWKRIK